MMNREQGQFEPVGDASLIIDIPQVVLNYLFLRAELQGDVLVLAALHDERDDLHLLWSETVADPGTDRVAGIEKELGIYDLNQFTPHV